MSGKKYLIGDIRIDGVKYSAEFLTLPKEKNRGLLQRTKYKSYSPSAATPS